MSIFINSRRGIGMAVSSVRLQLVPLKLNIIKSSCRCRFPRRCWLLLQAGSSLVASTIYYVIQRDTSLLVQVKTFSLQVTFVLVHLLEGEELLLWPSPFIFFFLFHPFARCHHHHLGHLHACGIYSDAAFRGLFRSFPFTLSTAFLHAARGTLAG